MRKVREFLQAAVRRSRKLVNGYPAHAAAMVVILLFLPMFIGGEVIAPLNQGRYIDPGYGPDGYQDTHLLSDYISSFIPRAAGQLSDNREAFVDLWDPGVEAGMPTIQLGATSKAFPVFLAASFFSQNPYTVLTLVCVFAMLLAAAGLTQFARGEGIDPLVAISIGLLAVLSWRMTLWIAFPQYIYGLALTFLAMFLARRYVRLGDWLALGWLVPVLYMILLGSRPAFTVAYVYIAVAYVALCLWRINNIRAAMQRLVGLSVAGVVAVLLALPNYLGLAATAANSIRASSPESFFLRGLHDITSLSSMFDWVVMLLNAWGWVVLPLFLVSLLLIRQEREMLFWALAATVPLLLSVTPALYVYFVRYLGFNISSIDPSWFALGPVLMVIALGLQRLISDDEKRTPALVLLTLFALAWAGLAMTIWPQAAHGIRPELVLVGAVSLVGTLAAVFWKARWLLLASLVIPAFVSTIERLPTRPLESIQVTSPLLEAVRENLRPGQRYVKTDGVVFSPRTAASLGLHTLHYIDSLSSEAANTHLAERLTGRPGVKLGRKFTNVRPHARACSEADYLRLLNVAVVISDRRIACDHLQPMETVQAHYLYRPVGDLQETFLLKGLARAKDREDVVVPESRLLAASSAEVVTRRRDSLEVRVLASVMEQESIDVLVLSQQYHPDWKARAGGKDLSTVRVNGFLLGVVLPADLDQATLALQFKPVTRWLAASVFVILALCAALLAISILRRRKV